MPSHPMTSSDEEQEEEDNEELPPLETASPEEIAARQTSSKLIKYDSESNSDSDAGAVNDLEELD